MAFAPHMESCLSLSADMSLLGLDFDWHIIWNESLVHRARMEMTYSFLQTDFKAMMWLDADIDFKSDDVAKLHNLDADIAVGVYPMKKEGEDWYAAWKDGELVKDLDQFKEPIEVDYAGTGFMMIKREVIETLAKDAPTFQGKKGQVPALYLTPIRDGVLFSEDYFFCERARGAGYKIMMDPSVKLGHWGIKRYGI
jgi:hypothetical protein